MIKIIIIFAITTITMFADSTSNQDIFLQGNNLYSSKQYDQAIAKYNIILEKGFESPALYYNLGNAYYRLGKLGYAILNYERARRLAPNDKEISNNLHFLQNKIKNYGTLPILPMYNALEKIENMFSINFLTFLCYLTLVIFLVSIGIYIFAKRINYRKISFFASIGILILFFVLSTILIFKYKDTYKIERGIITASVAEIKNLPNSNSRELFKVYEGESIVIESKSNDWLKVTAIDGKTGWILAKSLSKI